MLLEFFWFHRILRLKNPSLAIGTDSTACNSPVHWDISPTIHTTHWGVYRTLNIFRATFSLLQYAPEVYTIAVRRYSFLLCTRLNPQNMVCYRNMSNFALWENPCLKLHPFYHLIYFFLLSQSCLSFPAISPPIRLRGLHLDCVPTFLHFHYAPQDLKTASFAFIPSNYPKSSISNMSVDHCLR